jgi:hypothetical protein
MRPALTLGTLTALVLLLTAGSMAQVSDTPARPVIMLTPEIASTGETSNNANLRRAGTTLRIDAQDLRGRLRPAPAMPEGTIDPNDGKKAIAAAIIALTAAGGGQPFPLLPR